MGLLYILPLLSALIYVIGALFLKRSADLGADVWRITCVCNWFTALAFLPLLALGGSAISLSTLWQPAVVALLFIAGQTLAALALRIGDVSVATPVLGAKIILVALFTTAILGESISTPLWIAAALSSLAIALLNRSDRRVGGRVGTTILSSGAAAASFALFDVLVMKWAPAWGPGRFLPVMMSLGALFSLLLWPLSKPHAQMPVPYRRTLIAGALCLGVQSALFVSTIAVYGRATAANVLYSSRGLWSVIAVWVIGHWFENRERHLGRQIMIWRTSGAALMLAAIVLVVVT